MLKTAALVFLCTGAALAGGLVQPAAAQSLGEAQSRFNRAAVYRYAAPDDVTMQVSVWGTVQNPGIYEVPQGMSLNMLFSAAGGPSLQIRQRSDAQTVRLKLVRETENGSRRVIYSEVMEDEILVSEENPVLQEGDVLTVESFIRPGVNWRDLLSIGTSLASLVLTAVSLATR